MLKLVNEPHLCIGCYEVGKGYTVLPNGQMRCAECGEVALDLQGAADYIAEQASEIRALKEIYEP